MDLQKAHRIAYALKMRTVRVNSYGTLSFNTPFGGYKMNDLEAHKQYTEVNSMGIELSDQWKSPPSTSSEKKDSVLSRFGR